MTNESAWNVTVHSDNRMNRMTNIPNTGAVLAGLDKTKHGLLICTSSGSGLIKDHVYLCNADGDSLIDLSVTADHYHTGAGDGGSLVDVYVTNAKFMDLYLSKTPDNLKINWNQATTSTGTIADDTDGTSGARSIKLLSGATSGATSTIYYPHLKIDFTESALFMAKVKIETTSSVACRSGVGADSWSAADSNTQKFNAEVCTSVNNNWHLRTANGSGNSQSDTGTAMTASAAAININHLPNLGTPETRLSVDGATTLQKTSHVPITGASASDNLVKHSVKNSTAANRNYFVYASRLSYYINDVWY